MILIGIHAVLGELGALAFLWVLVELISPTEARVRRAKIVALAGVLLLCASWVAGGLNYLDLYQAAVKPVIKAGPLPWAHSVITETKEHVFLFIPFLAFAAWAMLTHYGSALAREKGARVAVVLLAALVVLMSFAMAGMGFLISSGYRSALEATV